MTGIVFSVLTVASCHFLKYIDGDGNQGAVGLYRYYNVSTSQCVNHDDSVSYNESENAARMGAAVAPMAATFCILVVLVEFCCCRFMCSRLFMGLGLVGAQIMQGITFLLFDSEQFWYVKTLLIVNHVSFLLKCASGCDSTNGHSHSLYSSIVTHSNGDIVTEILHQEPCSIGDGAVFSVVALLLYFLSGVLVFCTPKPEPMRTKNVDVESSSQHTAGVSSSSIQSPSVTMNDVENTPMGSSKSASWT